MNFNALRFRRTSGSERFSTLQAANRSKSVRGNKTKQELPRTESGNHSIRHVPLVSFSLATVLMRAWSCHGLLQDSYEENWLKTLCQTNWTGHPGVTKKWGFICKYICLKGVTEIILHEGKYTSPSSIHNGCISLALPLSPSISLPLII